MKEMSIHIILPSLEKALKTNRKALILVEVGIDTKILGILVADGLPNI
jgi:hypothetical protein